MYFIVDLDALQLESEEAARMGYTGTIAIFASDNLDIETVVIN